MDKEEQISCLIREAIFFLLFPVLLILGGCLSAEGRVHSIQGKEGFPYFDQQGNLSLVYIDARGGISLSTFKKEKFVQKISTQEIYPGDKVGSVKVKKDKEGNIWLMWEEREYERSDIYIAQLINKEITQPIQVTSYQQGFNFSPCMDFSFGNEMWISWVNYFQKEYMILAKNVNTGQTWIMNSSLTSSACSPQIIVDGMEKIWVFWVGQPTNHDEILYARFDGQSWSPPLSLNQDADFPHISPSSSQDFNGFPHVVWSAYDGRDYELYYSHWNGLGWSPEEKITNDDHITDISPCLGLFLGTNPIIAWLRHRDGLREICLTYKMGERWIPESVLSVEKNLATPPKLVFLEGKIGVLWHVGTEVKITLLHLHQLYRSFLAEERSGDFLKAQSLDRDKYIGFGDSITLGVINHVAVPEKGYIPRLEELIDANIKNSEVINRGVGGEKTADGLSRIYSVIDQDQAKTLFLMEGSNDVKDLDISTDTAAFNLKNMAKTALDYAMDVFLASIIPLDSQYQIIIDRVPELNKKIKSAANELKVYFVDQFKAFGGTHSGSLYYSDATHPNERGYQLIAETWYEALVDTLPSIETDPSSLSFTAVIGKSNPSSQVFKIRNSGEGTLKYQISPTEDWIGVSPTSGESTGEWDEIQVSVDISDLDLGSHQGQISITAEYTPNSPQSVSIDLDISGPVIETDKTSLLFEAIKANPNPSPQVFQIRNSGEGTLKYQISPSEDWVSVTPTSGESTGEWDEIQVSVDITNLLRGDYQAELVITAENVSNSPLVLTVNLNIQGPSIELDKASLSFEALKGGSDPSAQKFKIRNSGEETLKYQISPSEDWVSVTPTSGESTGEWDEIQVSVDITNLLRGDYQAELVITAENVSNSPQVITVSLKALGPMISLNKSSVSFEAVAGGANPLPQRFKIQNSGEGILKYAVSTDEEWLTVSPTSGESTGEWDSIEITADISGLFQENYQTQLKITAEDASNSPQILSVILHIQLPPLFSPLNFRGERKANRSLSQMEYINVLTWEANPQNIFLEQYRIYLVEEGNESLLEELGTETHEYWHRRVEKDKVYKYGLTVKDKFGRESEAVYVEIR
jgi:lysophospholipase L1-like esterase